MKKKGVMSKWEYEHEKFKRKKKKKNNDKKKTKTKQMKHIPKWLVMIILGVLLLLPNQRTCRI